MAGKLNSSKAGSCRGSRPSPVANSRPHGKGADDASLSLKAKNRSILVVDDDEGTREMESLLLQMLGYRVETAGSGEEAVACLGDRQIDLLVLDMTMSGIDGAETYRRVLRERPEQRAIVVSGLGMRDQVVDALEMGASAYVCKPVRPDTLALAVEHALKGSRRASEGARSPLVSSDDARPPLEAVAGSG